MVKRGVPYLLVLDETHALLSDPSMAKWMMTQLQEGRKNRCVVVMCFQRVSTLEAVGQDILSLTPTRFILPNYEADEDSYRNFLGLSMSEYEIVRGRSPVVQGLDRFAVVKRDGEGTVVLNIDMKDRLRTEDGQSLIPLFASGPAPADSARACSSRVTAHLSGSAAIWPKPICRSGVEFQSERERCSMKKSNYLRIPAISFKYRLAVYMDHMSDSDRPDRHRCGCGAGAGENTGGCAG